MTNGDAKSTRKSDDIVVDENIGGLNDSNPCLRRSSLYSDTTDRIGVKRFAPFDWIHITHLKIKELESFQRSSPGVFYQDPKSIGVINIFSRSLPKISYFESRDNEVILVLDQNCGDRCPPSLISSIEQRSFTLAISCVGKRIISITRA